MFGRPGTTTASAPGRVNLIGEHTDYNDGFVLPMPIPQRTRVELGRREDGQVRVWSVGFTVAPAGYALGEERRGSGWLDYVKGVTWALREAGHPVPGADILISTEVPVGSGLSSSASLQVAILRGLRALFEIPLGDEEVAHLAWRSEHDFVGAPVGVMDQMVVSLGEDGVALFIDARTRETERVHLPGGVGIAVVDSGLTHQNAGGDYRQRREECEAAARLLGVAALRDVEDPGRLGALPEVLQRRARHVVTENARVLAAVAAIRAGDAEELGRLMSASHASMRDDFAISVPGIDRMVEVAEAQTGVYGARLTGAGFGGSIVLLARTEACRAAATAVVDAGIEGVRARVLVPRVQQ